MSIIKNTAWAFVPARGGSKSIPLKNLANLEGRPLMDYSVIAAKKSNCFEKIICSTDSEKILINAIKLSVEVDKRPKHLGGDDISTKDVILEYLSRCSQMPEFVFIVEPTSPFLRVEDIRSLLKKMISAPDAATGQTIVKPPHTHHAWNQRIFNKDFVSFMFNERKTIFRKQDKPDLYIFGNLIACRTQALLEGMDVFSEPSVGIEIEWPYDINIDHENDLTLANALISYKRLVNLPHINNN